jgi:hypothetical protein
VINWEISGAEFANCNCAWGCPCQFNALPTFGDCRAVFGMRIEKGHFGDTRLDGLAWVGTVSWPGPIHFGNGTQQFFIDERAIEEQRKALVAILYGKEAKEGTMFQIYNSLCTNVLDPVFCPVDVEVDVENVKGRLAVPNTIEAVGGPIISPFSGEPHRVSVSLRSGFEYTTAEYGSGTSKATGQIPLDLKGSYAHFAHLHQNQDGIVRT